MAVREEMQVDEPADVPAAARQAGLLTAADEVAGDTACVQCRYNLRTLAAGANCPECGAAVADTLRHQLARPREWLEKMRRGTTALAVSIGVFVVLLVLTFAAVYRVGPLAYGRVSPVLLGVISAALAIAGVLFVTAPEPRRAASSERLNARWLARAATLLGAAGIVWLRVARPALGSLGDVLLVANWIAAAVALPALSLHLASSLDSLARPKLARLAHVEGWAILGLIVEAGAVNAWMFLTGALPPAYTTIVFVTFVAFAVLLIGALGILVAAAFAFNRAAWPEVTANRAEPA